MNYLNKKWRFLALLSFFISSYTFGEATMTATDKNINDQQLIYQQERQKAVESALSPKTPYINLLPEIPKTEIINFPKELICFNIDKVDLVGRDTLPFIIPLYSLSKQAEGQCLGSEGVNLLMSELQNQIISYGYITTRIVAPQQDLTTGTLTLLIVKGVVHNVYYSKDSDTYANLYTTMPVKKGDILNLRDIEQGLENLQRMPTQSAHMKLIPSHKPGESDIMITRAQSKYWRVGLSLDDSGAKNTGRYQGGLTFYLDNPLSLSDSFYATFGNDLERKSHYGSQNYLFSYSVPFGYWLFNSSLGSNTYHQVVAGSTDYNYSGLSRSANMQISRVIHRNESQKTTISYGINIRKSHNYINDTEIDLQRRQTTNWVLGINHRHSFKNTTLNIGTSYKKGVRWFGAIKAPEEEVNEGSALSNIINLNASLSVPFSLVEQSFSYSVDYQGQFKTGKDLTAPDRFSIGSRWTVRGFDGEQTLSADQGWFLRNEFSWRAPYQQNIYIGLDVGEVSGTNSEYLVGKQLMGTAIGVRSSLWGVSYDLFAGKPLYKPNKFKTSQYTLGFNLSWSY